MRPIAVTVIAALALATAACAPESPVAPPAPRTGVTDPSPSPTVAVTPDPSVPPATASVGAQPPTPAQTAKDSPATQPTSSLTKEEEKTAMPMAAHGNNHSSPSLEARPASK